MVSKFHYGGKIIWKVRRIQQSNTVQFGLRSFYPRQKEKSIKRRVPFQSLDRYWNLHKLWNKIINTLIIMSWRKGLQSLYTPKYYKLWL